MPKLGFPSMFASLLKGGRSNAIYLKRRSLSTDRKMTTLELLYMKKQGKKISMVTAYDYPSGKHADNADFDIILVGDSLGMVVLGYDTTLSVTMEDMLHHCKAVRRGAPSRFIVGDMPFGSYESGPDEALKNAFRFIKEAGVDAVKLEGGIKRVDTVRRLVDSGVAVMGHIGLTPQGIGVLGGFRAQGRTAVKARSIVDDAIALQNAGAFALGEFMWSNHFPLACTFLRNHDTALISRLMSIFTQSSSVCPR